MRPVFHRGVVLLNHRTRKRAAAATLTLAALLATPNTPAPPAADTHPASVLWNLHAVRAPTPQTLVASTPTQKVEAGKPIVIVGKARPRDQHRRTATRRLILAERIGPNKWTHTGVRPTRARTGAFVFTFPAGLEPTIRVFRVEVTRQGTSKAAHSRPVKVQVVTPAQTTEETPTLPPTPTPLPPTGDWDPVEYPDPTAAAPLGDTNDWTWVSGTPARWNPCQVLTWTYDSTNAYPNSETDMKRAFARVAGHTGLRFKQVTTSQANISIEWADAHTDGGLGGNIVGYASVQARSIEGHDVAYMIDSGHIVFDADALLAPGYTTSGNGSWGQTMQHELLHVVGLGHSTGNEQVMYPYVQSTNHLYGAGDITGMARIGASHDCLA